MLKQGDFMEPEVNEVFFAAGMHVVTVRSPKGTWTCPRCAFYPHKNVCAQYLCCDYQRSDRGFVYFEPAPIERIVELIKQKEQ